MSLWQIKEGAEVASAVEDAYAVALRDAHAKSTVNAVAAAEKEGQKERKSSVVPGK